MSGTTFLKTSALMALAAVTVALPIVANAQDAERERGEHRGGGFNREPMPEMVQPQAERVERQQQMPQEQVQQQQVQRQDQAQAQAQVQAQVQAEAQQQAQAQRGWRGREEAGQGRPQAVPQPGAGWQGRYQGQAQAPQTVPAQRGWQGGQYQGRNQGYVDAQRNRAYGGDRHDGDQHDGDRHDGDRREANRVGQWQGGQWRGGQGQVGQWQGNRWQGNRWQGNQWQREQQPAWNNGWRRDQRYNWQGYRNQNRNIFRGGRYNAPYNGYSYRQLSIGFFLDQAFFGESYWIGDPGYYRLPPASGPFRWVRYYDDVLLVNIYTGEVVDEIHDFFW